jgi:tRNA(Ile)-lysidine synthase
VALLDALVTCSRSGGFRVVAAHLDHGLRRDSARDAAFCAQLAGRLGVELATGSADVRARAARDGLGLEAAARAERHAFLERVRRERGASAIALAHTRDDQAETLLLRLLRGSGRHGLGAMRPRRGRLIRPLLGVSRDEVLAHLAARGLSHLEDPTNRDLALARNRVRHELIPYLEAHFNPRLRETLARTAGRLADEARYLEALAIRRAGRVARGELTSVDVLPLARMPEPLCRIAVRRVLRAAGGLRGVGGIHVERLVRLARSGRSSGRRIALPGGREAAFACGELSVGPRPREVRTGGGLAAAPPDTPGERP